MVKKILFIQNRTGIKRSNFFDHWESDITKNSTAENFKSDKASPNESK